MKVWMRGRSVPLSASRAVDVQGLRAAKPGDGGLAAAHPGDLADRLEVLVGGDGETCLDDVDAQPRELLGEHDLFGNIHGETGRLFAVPEGRVEDGDATHILPLEIVLQAISAGIGGIRQRQGPYGFPCLSRRE